VFIPSLLYIKAFKAATVSCRFLVLADGEPEGSPFTL